MEKRPKVSAFDTKESQRLFLPNLWTYDLGNLPLKSAKFSLLSQVLFTLCLQYIIHVSLVCDVVVDVKPLAFPMKMNRYH